MKIALSLNPPPAARGDFKNKEALDAIHGAGWIWMFSELAESSGHTLTHERTSDSVVIQEEWKDEGRPGQKKILLCAESPMFTPDFYDHLPELIQEFPRQMLFNSGTDHLYFPSFHPKDIRTTEDWRKRRTLCMISANKHYTNALRGKEGSKAAQFAVAHQLHDFRYQAISQFVPLGYMDLYGYGWPEAYGKACDDKLDTLSQYKYSLVIENIRMPGYVTEKIIHCMVAGTIPIYIGAPDIASYIPKECFLILEPGRTPPQLEPDQEMRMLWAARDFLASREGLKYTHFGFATEMLRLVEELA